MCIPQKVRTLSIKQEEVLSKQGITLRKNESLQNKLQWNLDLRKPDLRKNLDLRKIVGGTDFLVHKLFDLRKIF